MHTSQAAYFAAGDGEAGNLAASWLALRLAALVAKSVASAADSRPVARPDRSDMLPGARACLRARRTLLRSYLGSQARQLSGGLPAAQRP